MFVTTDLYGNLFKTQLSSTGPLVEDKLFYRISGSYKKGDGLITNDYLKKEVDFIKDLSLRAQLKAILSSKTSAILTAQIINAEAGATYYAAPTTGLPNINPDDFDNLSIQADQFGRSTLDAIYGNLKFDFNLGDLKLISSSTYNKGERNHIGDLDFTSADVLRQIQDSNTETINQEFRLSPTNTDSKFTWDLGAFYQKLDKQLVTDATADFGFFAVPPAPTGTQTRLAIGNFTNTFNTIAAFGFAEYKVSDRFTIAAGLRYDSDNIKQDNVTEKTTPKRTDSQLQPKLSLSLKATDNMLVYANYGRGYRTGGFNQGNTVRYSASFKAETTDNYEIGIKNNYWNDRLILNISGYYINFNNQQLYALVLGEGNILIGNFNVPKSKSVGFEADFKLRTSNWLDILASYGLSKSKINKGTSTESTPGNKKIDVSDKNTPLIPQDSYSFALESNFDISEKITFRGNVNLKGTGKIYWHEDNVATSSGYSLLNTRLGFTFSDKFTLNLWGNNLTDKQYLTEFFAKTFSNGGADLAWLGQPLSYGASIVYKF